MGENGQGKTNFLESVYILCFGSSFRTRNDKNICSLGEEMMKLSGRYTSPSQHVSVELLKEKKTIKINDKGIKDRREMIKNFPCIVYSYEDMKIINGAPEFKRQFLNQTLSLYDEMYIDNFKNYRRILKTRNKILKEKKRELLDIYDYQLSVSGQIIQEKRRDLIDKFNKVLSKYFRAISGDQKKIEIKYFSSWNKTKSIEDIMAVLSKKREIDFLSKSTSTGPHRDKIVFSLENNDYSFIASTGQIRLLSLIIKSAQAEFCYSKTGIKPILLFDDVLIELDQILKNRFLNHLPTYKQSFFTFLPHEKYRDFPARNAEIFFVNSGNITPYD